MRLDWESILQRVPNDLDGLAKSTGAIKRRRKLTTGEKLLWLSLMHAGLLISFRSMAAIGARSGVAGSSFDGPSYPKTRPQ